MGVEKGLLISASGTWKGAGLHLPPMVVQDLFFYNDNADPCRFSVGYVIDNQTSRQFFRREVAPGDTAEFHFEAGIDSRELRFGTITAYGEDPQGCPLEWVAMGYEVIDVSD